MGFFAVLTWLIFWLVHGTPELNLWNTWAVSLTICLLWWFFD